MGVRVMDRDAGTAEPSVGLHHEETERHPWCFDCDCYSVPNENGECGNCGSEVKILTENPRENRLEGDGLHGWARRLPP